MKILYGSDIHLEFQRKASQTPVVPECDLLLLAGDVFTPWEMNTQDKGILTAFLQEVSSKAAQTYMIMGNHEHYSGIFTRTAGNIRNRLDKFPNIQLLDKEVVEYQGVKIFGHTFWTDARNNHPEVVWDIQRNMNDYERIKYAADRSDPYVPGVIKSSRLRVEDTINENHYARLQLKEFLALEGRKIVLTHTAPDFDNCTEGHNKLYNTSYAYANTGMEAFLYEQENTYQWVYGHTHERKQGVVGKCHYYTNARGYCGMEPQKSIMEFEFKELP